MINMYFFLKFKAELRRTRPELVQQVDESISRAITDVGGKIASGRSVISASFNEETIGFWLDIYILIETLQKSIEASSDFYGFSLVITGDVPESPEMLCRFLASGSGGVFFDLKAAKRFIPYADFEKPSQWHKVRKSCKYGSDGFYRVKGLRVFSASEDGDFDLDKDIINTLSKKPEQNALLLGRHFSFLHGTLNKYCQKINGDFPPLVICFGSIGLGSLVDAWSGSIRRLASTEQAEEIDNCWELLFRERIRDEVSDYIVRSVFRFLSMLFNFYVTAARRKKLTPVLILENIHLAGKKVTDLLLNTFSEIKWESGQKLVILGTGEDDMPEERLQLWRPFFENVINIDNNLNGTSFPRLPAELWEIVYSISLFGRYFSPELFQRLFEEDEKNPVMIARAFSILQTIGVIDNPREPRIKSRYYEERARRILGDKAARVRQMVCGRLLSWAERRNINPCYRLLSIITSLDGIQKIDDLLLLKSISSDIINETISSLENAIKNGQLEELVSPQRAALVRFIFYTSRALQAADEHDIDKVFLQPPDDCDVFSSPNSANDSFPVLKAQLIVNLCGYYLGRRDKAAATEKAKEAILLSQSRNPFCLPQAYRLFSLVCLSKQQTSEAIEYLGFSLTNAEKSGNYHEMGITSYYAAASQFLYGDVYSARQLAKKSVTQSLAAGRADWADRARFLEGRLEFDIGHYREAYDIFCALRKEPYGVKSAEKDSLLAAWIYRSEIYFGDPKIPKPRPANHDADLFEIEAAFLAGDFKKAYSLSSSLTSPPPQEHFLYTELPDWSSGFAQCEHLYFSQDEIQGRLVCLFHSLAESHLPAESGTEALQNIQRILRDERLCEMDPWDAVYFYAKYLILEKTKSSIVDLSTAVSMAFKRLQRRAGRIEDVETRRQYLNGPRWNRELSLAAKDFKLI